MVTLKHDSREEATPWERYALGAGVAFAALQVGAMAYFVAFVFPNMGEIHDVGRKMAFYTQQGEVLRFGNYLMMLPAPFLLLFLAGLLPVLRRAEGGSGTLSLAAILAGAPVAILWPLSGVLNNLGIDIAQAGGDTATIVALDAIGVYTLALSALPRALMMGAAALALWNEPRLPRWVAGSGLGLALVSLISSATLIVESLFPLLLLGTLLFELWVGALSLALLRRPRAAARPLAGTLPA